MAKKPDGAAAGTQRVTFTKGAAERIGRVVREVEFGNRDLGPIEWGPRGVGGNAKVFRVCTFTGAWSIGSAKTVTFRGVTTTPNTVSASNLFFPITNTASSPERDCAVAKDGTAWYLIDVRLVERTAVFVSSTASGIVVSSSQTASRVTDVTLSASLNPANCTITIGKTLVTAAATFVTGTATGVFVQSMFTGTYLAVEG